MKAAAAADVAEAVALAHATIEGGIGTSRAVCASWIAYGCRLQAEHVRLQADMRAVTG